MLFKGQPAGRKSTNLAPTAFLLPGFAPWALVWLFWIDRTIEILQSQIVKCIGLLNGALISDLTRTLTRTLDCPAASLVRIDPSKKRLNRGNNSITRNRKLQRYGSVVSGQGAPIVINITSSKLQRKCSRRIFMAGGNGLAIGMMVIGFVILFLVPLYFLTSLFQGLRSRLATFFQIIFCLALPIIIMQLLKYDLL